MALAIAAIAQKVGNYENRPLAIILAVAAVLLLLYYFTMWARERWSNRDSKPSTTLPNPNASGVHQEIHAHNSPTLAVTGPTGSGSMHVNIGGHPASPQPVAATPRPSERLAPKLTPSLICCGLAYRQFTDRDQLRAAQALAFRNDVMSQRAPACDVRSHLTYTSQSGKVVNVNNGKWIEENWPAIEIGMGETKHVALAVLDRDDRTGKISAWIVELEEQHYNGSRFWEMNPVECLDEGTWKIYLELVGEGFKRRFECHVAISSRGDLGEWTDPQEIT